MAFKTWVARFVVDHGKVTEEGGRLRTFQRRRLDEPDVDLHIIAEPTGVKGDDLGMQALDAIGRVFLQDRRSLTGGLQQALRSTHQTLLDWNRRSVPREQVSVGVTAAMVSGNLAYVTQAGPSIFYQRRHSELKRFTAEDDYAQPALGEGELEPMMRRFELEPGDMLVAASPTIDELLNSGELASVLDRGSEEALPELYLVTRDLPNFALFAVICTDEAGGEETEGLQRSGPAPISLPPEPRQNASAVRARRESRDSEQAGANQRTTAPTSSKIAGLEDEEPISHGWPTPAPWPALEPEPPSEPTHEPDSRSTGGSKPADARPAPEPALPAMDAGGASQKTPYVPPLPLPSPGAGTPKARSRFPIPRSNGDAEDEAGAEAPVMVAPTPVDISRPVVRLRNEAGASRNEYARTTSGPRRLNVSVSQPKFALLGAAVVLLIFIAVFAVPDLLRENRSQRVNDLISSAALQLQASAAEQDPGTKRDQLEETRRLSAEALRLEPLNTTAAELRQQATTLLSQLDAVFDLGPMTTLATLSRNLTGSISVLGVAVTPNTAYLLDNGTGRVVAVPLASQAPPSIVFEDGQTYGGTPAKKPSAIAWDSNATGGRLLVLDAERKLFELKPGTPPAPLALRRSNSWSSVAAISAYDGNLYVLDPKGNQVHRYLPSASGFDSEPTAAIAAGSGLEEAETMSVSGDIYISMKDGRVRRFSGGNDMGFSLPSIDRELKTITDIVSLAASQEIYIADSGNKRIVVGSREGAFVRQYVSNAFTDIRALSLDPTGSQMYVVVGDTLLTAPVVR